MLPLLTFYTAGVNEHCKSKTKRKAKFKIDMKGADYNLDCSEARLQIAKL